jgi:integrase
VDRLVKAADDRVAGFVLLSFDCMLTTSEIQGLQWSDLHEEDGTATIAARNGTDLKPLVPVGKRLRQRLDGLKGERQAAGDADPHVFKKSAWRRDLRRLATRVFGGPMYCGEAITPTMLVRSGRVEMYRTEGVNAAEEAAGLAQPGRERRFTRLTPSQSTALMERHQAAGEHR